MERSLGCRVYRISGCVVRVRKVVGSTCIDEEGALGSSAGSSAHIRKNRMT